MAALVSLLTVVSLSLLITCIATVALTLTGLSREAAKFQARSAFTGVGYTVTEMEVESDDWLADKELGELGLRQEGVVVLGIQRKNGRYVGAPKGHTRICSGDTLILYGRLPLLNELDQRGADWTGEQSHQQAVAQQQRNLAQQNREEAAENL